MAIGTNKGFRVNRCCQQQSGSVEAKIREEVPGGVAIIRLLSESNVIVYVCTGQEFSLPRNKVMVWDAREQTVVAELVMAADIRNICLRHDCLVVALQR